MKIRRAYKLKPTKISEIEKSKKIIFKSSIIIDIGVAGNYLKTIPDKGVSGLLAVNTNYISRSCSMSWMSSIKKENNLFITLLFFMNKILG